MKTKPMISAIMPLYNSEKFVSEAVNSILRQTLDDFELIIINDGSKDRCGEIVKNIKDDRIRFYERENKGFLYSLNECISYARGKYVARLDDDDMAYENRFAKQVEYLESNPNVVLCGSNFDIWSNGKISKQRKIPLVTGAQYKFSLMLGENFIPHSSFMMRRESLEKNEIKYEMFKQVPDFHMLTQMAEVGDIYRLPEPLVVYRIHDSQSTAVRSNKMKWGERDQATLWYVWRTGLDDNTKKDLMRGILRQVEDEKDRDLFIKAFISAARYCGLETDNSNDKKCLSYLLSRTLKRQRIGRDILRKYRGTDFSSYCNVWDYFKLAIMSMTDPDKYYIESCYDIADNGETSRHE